MRSKKLALGVCLMVLLSSALVAADPDDFTPGVSLARSASILDAFKPSVSLYFDNQLFLFNNGDLRSIDDTSTQTLEQTDDKVFIGYLEVGGIIDVTIKEALRFYFDVYRVGFWGDDSAEYVAANPIYFRHVFFSVPLFDGLDVSVGRFRYSMNPDRQHYNYVLTDIVDAVLLKIGKKDQFFGIDLMGDLFSMNAPTSAVYELHAHRHDNVAENFDGDVNIMRLALMLKFNLLNEENTKLTLRPYSMFSRIGATGRSDGSSGGNQQTAGGALGNNADNDWLLVSGVTAYTRLNDFSAYLEFAYSLGKDRTAAGLPDIDISGFMLHLSLAYAFGDMGGATLAAVYASGAKTDANGDYTSYGHVSFKGDKVGGWLFRDYYGVYPYTILGVNGITIDPTEAAKRSPMAAATVRFHLDSIDPFAFKKVDHGLDVELEFWAFMDTSKSGADFGSNTLPIDRYDQRRFGQFMGWELDLNFAYPLFEDLVKLGVRGAMFVPGKFYAHPVIDERSPSGNSTFFGLMVYTSLRL